MHQTPRPKLRTPSSGPKLRIAVLRACNGLQCVAAGLGRTHIYASRLRFPSGIRRPGQVIACGLDLPFMLLTLNVFPSQRGVVPDRGPRAGQQAR
jgi:hypothetical protein